MEEEVKQNETKNENKKTAEGLSIASMVLGIVSVVSFMTIIIPLPCAILALVFGIIGIKKEKNGKAIAGVTLGGVGLFLTIIVFILSVIAISALSIPNMNSLDINSLISNISTV